MLLFAWHSGNNQAVDKKVKKLKVVYSFFIGNPSQSYGASSGITQFYRIPDTVECAPS